MDLDVPGGDFSSLSVRDVERDEGSPPVMFKPRGCRRRRARWSFVVGAWDVDGTDVGGSVDPSVLTSSSYTHPLGSVGRRNRIGIFVVFLDESGQSIDQACGFRTIEVNCHGRSKDAYYTVMTTVVSSN